MAREESGVEVFPARTERTVGDFLRVQAARWDLVEGHARDRGHAVMVFVVSASGRSGNLVGWGGDVRSAAEVMRELADVLESQRVGEGGDWEN